MSTYSSSTLELAKTLSHTLPAWSSSCSEVYRVHEMCLLLSDRAYAVLSEHDYRNGHWPAPEASILGALQTALEDHRHDYAGQSLARLLVRFGCRQETTLTALHPWDRLMFLWQAQGHNLESILDRLRQADIHTTPSPEGMATLSRRLANPCADMGDPWGIVFSLLPTRAVFISLYDVGFEPPHHQLFESLCHSLGVEVEGACQSCQDESVLVDSGKRLQEIPIFTSQGCHWTIGYRYQGVDRHFSVEAKATRMNIDPVLRAFDGLMAELGRPERAFQFAYGPDDQREFGAFLAVHAEWFPPIARQLCLPLESSSD